MGFLLPMQIGSARCRVRIRPSIGRKLEKEFPFIEFNGGSMKSLGWARDPRLLDDTNVSPASIKYNKFHLTSTK